MKNTPRSILMILALIFCLSLPAQDIHFSQYYNAPLYTNPALTGIYKGDMRFMGNYRNQWTRVPVDYRSYSAAFDMKYFHKKMRKGFFGGGLIIISDEAGDSELGMTQLGLNVAYSQLLNEYNILSGGFQVGLGQRAFKTDNLTFGNQWNGDVFSATESSRENFSSTSFGYLDLGAGLNWHLQPEEGLRHLDIGLAAFHLNRPQQKFYEADDVPLPMRWSIYLSGEMEVNELWSIVFHSLGQKQGTYREGIAGVAAKYWLNKNRGKEMALQLGTAYRFIGRSDALIPSVELYYLAWKFGLSYDINTSDFEVATHNRGGLELSLQYIITTVKPTKEIKACPIF